MNLRADLDEPSSQTGGSKDDQTRNMWNKRQLITGIINLNRYAGGMCSQYLIQTVLS